MEAQAVMRFGVGEFAGLVVESSRPEFRATFRAEPSKAVKIAPFQEASAGEVSQNYTAIKAQLRAIVGGARVAVEQPEDFAIVKPNTSEQAPISATVEEEDDPMK